MEATYFMGSSVSPSTMDFPEDADNSGSISKLELVAAMQSHSAAAMVTMVMSPKPESPKKNRHPSLWWFWIYLQIVDYEWSIFIWIPSIWIFKIISHEVYLQIDDFEATSMQTYESYE